MSDLSNDDLPSGNPSGRTMLIALACFACVVVVFVFHSTFGFWPISHKLTGADMLLIIWYLCLVVVGDVLAYLAGRLVEFQGGGSNASMIVFLTMYFLTLWIAWVIAVKLTTPKPAV